MVATTTPVTPVLVELLNPHQIELSRLTVRAYYCPKRQAALEASMSEIGQIQPIICRVAGYRHDSDCQDDEIIEVVLGNRRLKSARNLGMPRIKAIVFGFRQLDDADALDLALADNLNYQTLSPIEEVEGVLRLIALRLQIKWEEAYGIVSSIVNDKKFITNSVVSHLTNNVVSQVNGDDAHNPHRIVHQVFSSHNINPLSFRNHKLPLLNLPEDLKEKLNQGEVSTGQALQLRRINDPKIRADMLTKTLEESWSLRILCEQINQLDPKQVNGRSRCRQRSSKEDEDTDTDSSLSMLTLTNSGTENETTSPSPKGSHGSSSTSTAITPTTPTLEHIESLVKQLKSASLSEEYRQELKSIYDRLFSLVQKLSQ